MPTTVEAQGPNPDYLGILSNENSHFSTELGPTQVLPSPCILPGSAEFTVLPPSFTTCFHYVHLALKYFLINTPVHTHSLTYITTLRQELLSYS